MQLTQSIKTLSVLAVILTALVGYQYTKAQNWTSPPANPPSSNVTLNFLDTSSASQVKMGALGTGALSVTGALAVSGGITGNGAVTFNNDLIMNDTSPTIRFNDTSAGEKAFRFYLNNNVLYLQADRNGDVSNWEGNHPLIISAGSPDASNDYTTFSNQVRATEYCDRSGNNCVTAGNVANCATAEYSQTISVPFTNGDSAVSCSFGNFTCMANYCNNTIGGPAQARAGCYGSAGSFLCVFACNVKKSLTTCN